MGHRVEVQTHFLWSPVQCFLHHHQLLFLGPTSMGRPHPIKEGVIS